MKTQDLVLKTYQKRCVIETNNKKEFEKYVLTVRHDDDDDDEYIYIYIYIS